MGAEGLFAAAWRRIEGTAFRPVDVAWLAAFRALFGLTMFVSMMRFIAYGWIDDLFVRPSFHFRYWGFGWVPLLSGAEMHALFWALAVLALAIAAGALYRAAGALFFVGFVYLQLVDVTNYLNHYYLAALLALLLTVAPAHRAYSVDAWLRGSSAASVDAAWLYLFRFQVGVVYTFAGLAKAHGDWLVHAQPLRIWLGSHTQMPLGGWFFRASMGPLVMSWAGFLFDTSIAWFLLARRTRPFAFAAVIVFHCATSALFPIGMFPVIMVLSALVFFPPEWPRAAARVVSRGRLGGRVSSEAPSLGAHTVERATGWRRAAMILAASYCLFQATFPLRFLLYGGNVLWHEQGMRFSWRVMVREKNGSVTYVVRSKQSGRTWQVSPRAYLTRSQEREISGQPDLILQLAHAIRDDFERRGQGPVEVHADALVSLNGRRLAPLIDPEVDLAAVSDAMSPASWIAPHPAGPPPHIRPL